MNRSVRIEGFVSELWSWYVRHKRVLPWRDLQDTDDTQRAYKVLVSEIMLQQTQVSRVIIKYREFLHRFPRLQDLAPASNKEVIIAWKGMGYNSRALRLRDAARTILERSCVSSFPRSLDHKKTGKPANEQTSKRAIQQTIYFPKEMDELLAIKGIGSYTAAAIRNFAFNLPTSGIDTNIRRVLHRTFFGPEDADGTFPTPDKTLLALCDELLVVWEEQGHQPRDFFAALMDFGSLVHTKSNPKWDICPLTDKGIMKTTKKSYESRVASDENAKLKAQSSTLREPGRFEGARYVPNRIFRGRIVDELREAPRGLTLETLGAHICNDWGQLHKPWLTDLLHKLERDHLIEKKGSAFVLKD